jgi:hypothetical protein
MKKTINVITIRGGKARHETIKNDLQTMQKIVGGRIETYTVGRTVVICDEEGRLKGKEPTMRFNGETFVGDLIICGISGSDFTDVPRYMRVGVMEVGNNVVAE